MGTTSQTHESTVKELKSSLAAANIDKEESNAKLKNEINKINDGWKLVMSNLQREKDGQIQYLQ